MKDMKRMTLFLFAAALVILSPSSWAQDKPATSMWQAPFPDHNIPMTAEGEVLTTPVCFRVVNRADYTITGSLYTNYYIIFHDLILLHFNSKINKRPFTF